MRPTRRGFLAGAAVLTAQPPARTLDSVALARKHALTRELATPDFFEGMLMGNGDIGLCVTVRLDALGLHLGKLDAWDIRVSEDHYQHVVPFSEFLKMWERATEEARRMGEPDMTRLESRIPFMSEYTDKVRSSYAQSWPRPWPCGSLYLHWDSRFVEVRRQRLDPGDGVYRLDLRVAEPGRAVRNVRIECFVNWHKGHVAVFSPDPAPILSVVYYPHIEPEAKLPPVEVTATPGAGSSEFFCFQRFPATAPTASQPDPPPSKDDSSFALCGVVAGRWEKGLPPSLRPLSRPHACLVRPGGEPQVFRLDLTLLTPRDAPDNVRHARAEAQFAAGRSFSSLRAESAKGWAGFWSRSAVELEDQELERMWFRNQYFLACCLRQGKVAPGLFGNWCQGRIGTAWHGDYHMNYNTQQVFWGVFSSNHVEQHLPYVDLVEKLMPMAEHEARENFRMPGAYFPHSAYPVPSKVNPYPVPPWGYEICETPWTVQSLWWHYLYTQDREYLKRAYPLLRAACRFLAAYMKKGGDGKYHIIPTVSPENWGLTAGYRLNRDCIIDLVLAEFVLKGTAEAARILDTDAGEREKWDEIASNVAPWPKGKGPRGEVWLDVLDAPHEHVYNVPVTLAPVFPGELVGLGRREDLLELARNSTRNVRLEGGNDLVWQPLARARLGMLDFDWFKREVRFCLTETGTAGDRTRQIGGRYSDMTAPDYMMRMGIWIENLSLPAVLNECLLQSYTGVIRLFPNAKGLGKARFQRLRAVGAFLVSAAWDGARVASLEIHSERGATARVLNPWAGAAARVVRLPGRESVPSTLERDVIVFKTSPGGNYAIEAG